MTFKDIAKAYLSKIQAEYLQSLADGQHTKELSFRTITDAFLRDASDKVRGDGCVSVVLEPSSQLKAGRPDWLFQHKNTLAIFGYIEAKPISETTFDPHDHQEQLNRYRSLGRKVMITDGIDFIFCDNDDSDPITISLFDKAYFNKDWSASVKPDAFEKVLTKFLSDPSPRKYTTQALVERIAARCKNLSAILRSYAYLKAKIDPSEEEKHVIDFITGLKRFICCKDSSTRLSADRAFVDFISQVVMFSLMYARKSIGLSNDQPKDREVKILKFLSAASTKAKLGTPGEIVTYILDNDKTNCIQSWIAECVSFLAFADIDDGDTDYHKLFELFLEEYDSKVRWDYGAFYTPGILSLYTVRLAEFVTKQVLGVGLYEQGTKIMDPCCGTGSFLESYVKNGVPAKGVELFGIEILPVPYMLAKYRLSYMDNGASNWSAPNIILADTLHNDAIKKCKVDPSVEGLELARVRSASGAGLEFITGNPPCSESSWGYQDDKYSVINDMMDDFRPPTSGRHARQNTQKQVNNTFVKFVRWACDRAVASKNNTTIAFVVPLSFLEAQSYQYARKYIADHFSSIWAVAVDADGRTGIRSNSMFHTLQGRAILVLTRDHNKSNNSTNSYQFADLSTLTLEGKIAALSESFPKAACHFAEHKIPLQTYSFIPAQPFDEDTYNKFLPISDEDSRTDAIFINHCSGIKLAPTALFTHVSKDALIERTKKIFKSATTAALWFKGQQKPPSPAKIKYFRSALEAVGTTAQVEEHVSSCIIPYQLRPFTYTNLLFWPELLKEYASVEGGGTRLRPEIIKTFAKANHPMGFAIAHSPKDQSATLNPFVSFCWMLSDNDMCRRGDAYIYLTEYCARNNTQATSNINSKLLKHLKGLVGNTLPIPLEEAVVYYCYAVLCSQTYLDEFSGALYTTNQSNWRPRIPFVNDADLFAKIVKHGLQLAELEKPDFDPDNILNFDYDEILSHVGSTAEINYKTTVLDSEKEVIELNNGANWAISIPCPAYVIDTIISGYPVIPTWIKFHSYIFTRKPFSQECCHEFLDLLNRLAIRSELISHVDPLVGQAITSKNLFSF